MTKTYVYGGLIVATLITAIIRTAPFLLLKDGKVNDLLKYLGQALPPAIMIILVIYSLGGVDISQPRAGLAEAISTGLLIGCQLWKRSLMLSMIVGTLSYMLLLRII